MDRKKISIRLQEEQYPTRRSKLLQAKTNGSQTIVNDVYKTEDCQFDTIFILLK